MRKRSGERLPLALSCVCGSRQGACTRRRAVGAAGRRRCAPRLVRTAHARAAVFPPSRPVRPTCSAKRRGPPLHSAATELSIGAGTWPRRSGQRGRSRGWTRTETVDAGRAAPTRSSALVRRPLGRRRCQCRRPEPRLPDRESTPVRPPPFFPRWTWSPFVCPWPLRAASGACDYAFESQVPEVARGRLVHWAPTHREEPRPRRRPTGLDRSRRRNRGPATRNHGRRRRPHCCQSETTTATSEERRPLPTVSFYPSILSLRFSRRIDRGQAVSGTMTIRR